MKTVSSARHTARPSRIDAPDVRDSAFAGIQAPCWNTKTSLRCAPLEHTLGLLQANMAAYGATRVTDTTRLDIIGVPVFAAMRPCAGEGSVSVTSGKSLDSMAARVGALAEAFELSSASYRPGESVLLHLSFDEYRECCGYYPWHLPIRASQIHAVRGSTFPHEVSCVGCDLLDRETPGLLPAVLAYFPYHADLGFDLYGMSTNGLASGNSPEEAVLHGLLEVIERDVISFVTLGASTRPVVMIDDDDVQTVIEAVRGAGLDLDIVFSPNAYGLPTFSAYLYDCPASSGPIFVGHGTHIYSDIAIMRACTEAVQSRLTHIHGARDDVIDYHRRWSRLDWLQKKRVIDGIRARNRQGEPIAFRAIGDAGAPATIGAALDLVKAKLRENGINELCVFRYPSRVLGMHAVRVVAPGLEFYTSDRLRVGERLLAYVRSRA